MKRYKDKVSKIEIVVTRIAAAIATTTTITATVIATTTNSGCTPANTTIAEKGTSSVGNPKKHR